MRTPKQTFRRRGSAYVLVLTTSMIVTVIGVSALTAVRLRHRTAEMDRSVAHAALCARSAVDMGLFWIGNDPDWRENRPNGDWQTAQPLEAGEYDLSVTDPTDGDLTNSWSDPVVVRGTGRYGRARVVYEVTLEADPRGARPIRPAVLSLKPTSYWPLQDAAGDTATDMTGGYDGTYTNGVVLNSYDEQLSDNTARFDGGNDYVAIDHHNDFLLRDGSVCLWFKPDSTSGEQGLFSKDATNFVDGGHLTMYLSGSRLRTRLQSKSSSYTVDSSYGSIAAGQWHHAVFTFGDDGMHLYLNGRLVDTDSYNDGLLKTGTLLGLGDIYNTEPIAIGVSTKNSLTGLLSGWNDAFGGRIAHVAIFDYQLDDEQVEWLHEVGQTTRTMRIKPGSWQKVVD